MRIGALLAFAFLIALWRVHGRMLRKLNSMLGAFRALAPLLRRKYRLVPPFVRAVRSALPEQRKALAELETQQARFLSTERSDVERVDIENRVGGLLRRVCADARARQQLAAEPGVAALLGELDELDAKIAVAAHRFNDAVAAYNRATRTAPCSFIARMMQLHAREPLAVHEAGSRAAGEPSEPSAAAVGEAAVT